LGDGCLQFGIKMPINASCDGTIMQATKSQKFIRKKNQIGFAGKNISEQMRSRTAAQIKV